MNSKNLHLHALPIAVLAIAASVLSGSFLLTRSNAPSTALLDLAKTPAFSVHVKSQGLANISFSQANSTVQSLVRPEHPAEQAIVIFKLQQ